MAGDSATSTAGLKGRRIVVAVDQGEESLYALLWCLNNIVSVSVSASHDFTDTLVLLYARPSQVLYPVMDGTGYLFSADTIASMDQCSRATAEAVMAKAKRACAHHPNVKVEAMVETGDARDVICKVVEKMGADMLVMGSHGYGVIKRALLGSVSSHCSQTVKCPVLIVKRPKQCVSAGSRG